MSQTHDIDNDVPFFLELDPYEPLNGSHRLAGYVQEPQDPLSGLRTSSPAVMSPSPDPSLAGFYSELAVSEGIADGASSSFDTANSPSSPAKGKGISYPLDIQRREPDAQIDVLPVVGSSSSSGDSSFANVWTIPPPSVDPFDIPFASFEDTACAADSLGENVGEPSGLSGKGKGRERPPTLPPLVFLPTGFDYGSPAEWSSSDMSPQTAGPSSYGSGFASIETAQSDHDVISPVTPEASAPLEHIPARRRSLSSLSVRSTRSLSALPITKVKVKLASAKRSGNIARKLLFKKGRDSTLETPPTSPTEAVDTEVELGRGSCFLPWAPPLKSCTSPPVGTLIDIDVDLSGGVGTLPPLYGPPSGAAILCAKGRSYSSPLPLPSSPLDIVPITTADIFEPIPVDLTNYFDEYLPRELKLNIFAAFVHLFEAEHRRVLSTDRWTATLAGRSRNRWVGIEKGIRELLKLSGVSRSWRSLVYDGQLWGRLPRLPTTVLSRLCETAGGFVQRLDFTGSTSITPDALIEMTDGLCVSTIPGGLTSTCLTTIDLRGCIDLTTRSLHYLLVRSPLLQILNVKGLSAVINSTCTILSTYCPNLVSLDMSRCYNLDGEGIRAMAATALDRDETLRLKTLRLNSLSRVTDDMMWCLGRAAPDLEVLDLSYAAPLHNSAIDAFVSLTEEEAQSIQSVQLSARQAGRDPADPNRYWRRVTRLRHIALSSCFLLTDHACSHLAHAVPKLEFLELAGVGADLRDDGLVRLLETTSYIRRVDLEDASEISDALLATLTPRMDENPAPPRRGAPPPPPQPGHALEHLIISSAADVTNDALLTLVRSCTRLRMLEADGTRMNSAVLKEFVQLSRLRKTANAYVAAIDCRGIGEHTVKELATHTRPRLGWRAWEARDLKYLDGRDDEDLNVGQDECDEMRVVLKTFYSWQTVDAVRAAREKRRKAARRNANGSGSSESDSLGYAAGRTRWWSPNGRRSGAVSPVLPAGVDGREGCTIM